MAWTYPVAEHAPKWVHHRCGCPLYVSVVAHMGTPPIPGATGESILVEYRLQEENGIPGAVVYLCPCCAGVLKLWWHKEESRKEETEWNEQT